MKTIFTNYNGTMPFKIVIDTDGIRVFSNNDSELLHIKKYEKIHIGKNVKKYSYYEQPFRGNTVLIEINDKSYVFVGLNYIKTFNTTEPIKKYYSIMGNSSVPYPFAISENYVYLLSENIYYEGKLCDKEPYYYYYKDAQNKKYKKMKTAKLIFRINI